MVAVDLESGRWGGGGPAAVGLGAVDLGEAGGLHAAGLDQGEGTLAVVLGPDAAAGAGGELLKEGGGVVGLALAVDPAVAWSSLGAVSRSSA